jgi:EpsI family protein
MTTDTLRIEQRWLPEIALGTVVAAALLFAFVEPLAGMVSLWDASPMYSYGYIVPFVSAYLLWVSRARLAEATPTPARLAGSIVLMLAISMSIVGHAGGMQVLGQIGFLVAIVGAVLLWLGTAYLRIVWPAIAYLLLMVPIWDFFTEPLHWPFQNQSAAWAMTMLRAVGVPVYREGTILVLPGITLEVARQCSGVNYLIAVLALGLPLSYLYLPTMTRRVALLAFALTIAALSNALRVTLIGILAHAQVGSPLHGPFHVLHGLFVAGIGYVALFAGLRLLARKTTNVSEETETRPFRAAQWRLPRLEGVALAALFLAIGSGVLAKESTTVNLNGKLDQLPRRLVDWEWSAFSPASKPTDWPGADVELAREYRLADGATADVYVGYFATQKQNKEIANAKADALHRRATVVTLTGDGNAFPANRVRFTQPDATALFWYEFDRVQTNAIAVRLQTLWNAGVTGRTNGAVVFVRTPSSNGGRAGNDDQLQGLAHSVRRGLAGLLPASTTAQGATGAAR